MKSEHAQEALHRAMANQSMANFLPIIEGFMEKGIDVTDIHPREMYLRSMLGKLLGGSLRKENTVLRWLLLLGLKKTVNLPVILKRQQYSTSHKQR
jgi:hypothetical protein